MASELRQDITSGEWVILSKDRGSRPHHHSPPQFIPDQNKKSMPCPFCPDHEADTPSATFELPIKNEKPATPWQVRVFPNKFPALSPKVSLALADISETNLFPKIAGYGFHEVIVETPMHDQDIATLSEQGMQLIFAAYQNRYQEWSRKPKIRTVVIFRNQGPRSGATIPHPHSQLLALPIIPASFIQRLQIAKGYWSKTRKNLYLEILLGEKKCGERVILESEHFLAFTPYAPRSSFETWILPKNPAPFFGFLSSDELRDLAKTLQNVLQCMGKALQQPDYNYVIYSSSHPEEKNAGFSWHMKIFPRLFSFAGFEIGSGMAILSVTPEEAAQTLRTAFLTGKSG